MSETKKTGLDLLREPFPAHQISKLPKPYKKDSPKGKCSECGGYHGLPAVHLDYVGHAALTDRLLDADAAWTWEPLGFTPEGLPAMDRNGGLWIKLTVCGVSRFGYGHAGDKSGGDAVKEVIGDALRNAAMRFGAALDLWHKGQLHADEDDDEPKAEPKAERPKKATTPVVPDGYDEWLDDLRAYAASGVTKAEFRDTYGKSKPEHRKYLETNNRPTLDLMLAKVTGKAA